MPSKPTVDDLSNALKAASEAHHEFEVNALNGQRDEQWTGWYAAYVLGRLGDFVRPSILSEWLERVRGEGDWSIIAAKYVYEQFRNS